MSTSSTDSSQMSRKMSLRSRHERQQVLRFGLAQTRNLRESPNKETLKTLDNFVADVDDIHLETSIDEKITNQGEVLLDSAAMNTTSKILKNCSDCITQNISSYAYEEYAQQLMMYVQCMPNIILDNTPWFVMESEVFECFLKIPTRNPTLLGALRPLEKKEVVKRTRMEKEPVGELIKPVKVVATQKEEESVEETVERIRKIISNHFKRKKKPIDFFRLVLHPTDFSKTIENLLHVSFLVRDNVIKVTKDKRGIVIIVPCTKEQITESRTKETVKVQNALTFTMKQWKKLVQIYKVKTPMIEHYRENVNHGNVSRR